MEKNLKIEFNKIFRWNVLASLFYEAAKTSSIVFSSIFVIFSKPNNGLFNSNIINKPLE